jgi:hypothetical protein
MALRIAHIKREKSLAAIARRVYRIEGPQAAELTRRAEVALLAANPTLGERAGFRAGGRVVVPSIAGLSPADAATTEASSEAAGVLEAIEGEFAAFSGRAEDAFQRAGKEAEKTAAELKSRALQQIIEKNAPALAAHLPEIQKNVDEDVKTLKARRAAVATALREAREDLATLSKKLGE